MPQAVTHILLPILLIALWRDIYKKRFSLHYILIAGLGGVIPDIDIIIFWLTQNAALSFQTIQTHIILTPLVFLILFFSFKNANLKARICNIGRHKLKLSIIFLMLATGVIIHLMLDAIFGEPIMLLFPFSAAVFGINLTSYIPESLQELAMPTLDGLLLVIWIAYLELRHKISDFI